MIDVTKRFGAVQALQATNLTITSEQTTVLIGQSGCGKSTMLRLMTGLLSPDTGQVLFEGTPLTPKDLRPMRHKMGYVIQDGGLFPHLTARQNITLLAEHLGRPAAWQSERMDELAELTHLPKGALARYPAQLSGGQRQRVSLMRSLMLDPDVLLLDEPLGALDPIIRRNLQEELHGVFDKLGKTVVMVTHDLGEAIFFAHEVVLMRQGRIVQKGPPRALLDEPAEPFVTEFVQAQRGPELSAGGTA